jgi:hypothetical protein
VAGDPNESVFGGIRVFEGKEIVQQEIAKRDFPISQGTMGPTKESTVDRWHRVSGYREFRGQGVHALRNREPRKPTQLT